MERGVLARIGQIIQDYWVEVVSPISTTLIAIFGFLASDEGVRLLPELFWITPEYSSKIQIIWLRLFLLFALISLVMQLVSVRRSKKLSKLIQFREILCNENKAIIKDIKQLSKMYLKLLADHDLKLSDGKEKCARMTLYIHNNNGKFIPVIRYSKNTLFETIRRKSYPDDEGFIALAWQHGEWFANDYPDPEKEPQEYLQRQKQDGLSDDTISRIRMKSRLYFGYRIYDEREDRAVGLIIVESTNQDYPTKEKLLYYFKKDNHRKYLRLIAERLSTRIGAASADD